MQKAKTHFEQVPIEVVEKMVEASGKLVVTIPANNRNPHRSPSLRKIRRAVSEISCSICKKPIAIEAAKTDETGQPVHEGCYLLKIRIKAGRTPAQNT
jgi:coenzyme F420-reducing hydrogenase beta subunit